MFLSFFFLLPYCYAIQWNYLSNTVWSSACDWGGNDLSNFQTTADNCGPKCLSTPGCTHFTWTTYNSGTCWLKTNWYSPSDAFDSTSSNVCGYVTYWQQSGNVVWAPYCDWQANDITGIPTTADQCGSACVNTAGCTHFTCSSGTCWVKRNSVSKSDAFLINIEDAVCGYLTSNPSPVTPPPKPPSPTQGERLRFVNRASSKIFLFYQSPKKRLTYPNPMPMAPGAVLDIHIPDGGLESCRFWPGWGCSPDGKDCIIGASGGVFPGGMSDGSDGGLYCSKTAGCGPAIDTKLEATFGCGNPGCNDDFINTSEVDGYTLPYTFKLMTPDGRGCNGGTASTILDCSNLDIGKCPTNEHVQSVGTVNLVVRNPSTLKPAGCFSPCGYLTFRQWNPNAHYIPGDSIAKPYCCPYPGVTPSQCSNGPVVTTEYVKLIHNTCPAYSYAFDDGFALQQCPPGTKYEMTFFDPKGVNFLTEEPNINVSPKENSINVTIISVTVGTIIGIIMIVVVVIIYRNSKKSLVERSENLP